MCVCTCVYVWVCAGDVCAAIHTMDMLSLLLTCTYIHSLTHTHTYTHTHTHAHTATPLEPYGGYASALRTVESNMLFRYVLYSIHSPLTHTPAYAHTHAHAQGERQREKEK